MVCRQPHTDNEKHQEPISVISMPFVDKHSESVFNPNQRYHISPNHAKGRYAEMQTVKALGQISGISKAEHNEWDNYHYCAGSCSYKKGRRVSGRSVDIEFDFKDKPCLVEVKFTEAGVCWSWLLRHVLERFLEVDPNKEKLWILVIAKLNCKNYVRALLEACGVHIVEVGNFDVKMIIKQLSTLFDILLIENVVCVGGCISCCYGYSGYCQVLLTDFNAVKGVRWRRECFRRYVGEGKLGNVVNRVFAELRRKLRYDSYDRLFDFSKRR